MIDFNQRGSQCVKLRIICTAIILTTTLLVGIQSAAASAPPVQIETSTDVEEPKPGEPVEIDANISNLANNNNQNVRVRYVWLREGGELDTYQQSEDVGVIAPGGELTIPFSVTFTSTGQKHLDLVITVSSEGDGSSHTYKKPLYIDVVDDSDLRGDVRLTSNSVTGSGTVSIEGDAANIGGTDVESVLLRVPETGSVSPSPPNGEYYVGGIETSEFGTYELTANIANGTDSVPVEITYITTGENRDDERVTKTQQIPVADSLSGVPRTQQVQATATTTPPSGGGPPILLIGGVAVLVVISILGVVLWRRQ